ncbi:MAG: HAD family hydrolase [Proteobacteria bacterium]|nr:HAD family hydrolase [Pseudomonadota bacterium]
MKIERFKTVFWDFDGVIKESVPVKTEAYLKLFEEYGEAVAEKIKENHEMHGGISRYIKIPLYYKEFLQMEISEAFKNEQFRAYSQLVVEKVIQSDWVGGVEDYLLNHYEQQNFYVVTGTPENEMTLILKELKIDHCFKDVFGAPAKKNEVIQEVIHKGQVQKEECLMIGDALTDYNAALDNNISFLLRVTGESQKHFKEIDCPRFENFLDQ